jgi:CrcB protein
VTAYLWVCLGAAVGAPARYLVDRAVQTRHDSLLPWGTLAVNVAGSFVLAVLTGIGTHHAVPSELEWLVGTGLCGALTTYSTFSYETLRLYEAGAVLYASANLAANLFAGLGAAFLGYVVGAAL